MTTFEALRRRVAGATNIGIGISRTEIRFVGVTDAGLLVWSRSLARGRTDVPLAELIGTGLAERPRMLRGRVRVACVIGPAEAQLRPLHGLPRLRSATELSAVVNESVDRFFVGEGSRMRVSSPVRARDGELWAAVVDRDVLTQVAEACRSHRIPFVGVAPLGAALRHLAAKRVAGDAESSAHVRRTDDGTQLHVVFDGMGIPVRTWRERATVGLPGLEGEVQLPDRLDPYFADAYAATCLRAREPFVIGEHPAEVRRARLAGHRTWLWAGVAAASLVAAAWLPGVLATRRADRARARLAALTTRQRELTRVQGNLAAATSALEHIASFERSRRSATLFLAELAMALPDSTAVTMLHVDSLGGTMTLLAPRAAGALETLSSLPRMARVQMTGAVTRETTAGAELERASLRFAFRGQVPRAATARDSASQLAMVAPPAVTAPITASHARSTPSESVTERPIARGGSQ